MGWWLEPDSRCQRHRPVDIDEAGSDDAECVVVSDIGRDALRIVPSRRFGEHLEGREIEPARAALTKGRPDPRHPLASGGSALAGSWDDGAVGNQYQRAVHRSQNTEQKVGSVARKK